MLRSQLENKFWIGKKLSNFKGSNTYVQGKIYQRYDFSKSFKGKIFQKNFKGKIFQIFSKVRFLKVVSVLALSKVRFTGLRLLDPTTVLIFGR